MKDRRNGTGSSHSSIPHDDRFDVYELARWSSRYGRRGFVLERELDDVGRGRKGQCEHAMCGKGCLGGEGVCEAVFAFARHSM